MEAPSPADCHENGASCREQNVCANNNVMFSDKVSGDGQNEMKVRERLNAQHKSSTLEDVQRISSTKRDSIVDCRMVVHVWATPSHPRFQSPPGTKHLSEPASSHKSSTVHPLTKQASSITLNSSFDDSVFYSANYEEVLETTRGLCRDYICYRLKRSGYGGRVVITKYAPAKDQNLSFDILKIGKTFEFLYPHLFRNLARQLGYVLKSEQELRVLFNRLGTNIIGPSPDGYTWARVLGLLGIAGGLSVDCIAQGHCELIEHMVTIFGEFVEANLLTWIMERGGWVGMVNTFAALSIQQDKGTDFLSCSFTKMFGVVLLTSVLFVAGITAFGILSKYNISYVMSKIL